MTAEACRVFILAGGRGTRLQALFPDQPKPMVPVAGRPFLELQLLLLAGQGFRDFVLCVGYRADQITGYFGDGARWGVQIAYSREAQPLGTAGALRQAAGYWSGPALVLNGDTHLDTDYRVLVQAHRGQAALGAIGSLGLVRVEDCSSYGQVRLAADGRIEAFVEKQAAPAQAGLVSAGVYVLQPAIMDAIPAGRAVSVEYDTFPALVTARAGLYGVTLDGTFIDIGTPQGHAALEQRLAGHPGTPGL